MITNAQQINMQEMELNPIKQQQVKEKKQGEPPPHQKMKNSKEENDVLFYSSYKSEKYNSSQSQKTNKAVESVKEKYKNEKQNETKAKLKDYFKINKNLVNDQKLFSIQNNSELNSEDQEEESTLFYDYMSQVLEELEPNEKQSLEQINFQTSIMLIQQLKSRERIFEEYNEMFEEQ